MKQKAQIDNWVLIIPAALIVLSLGFVYATISNSLGLNAGNWGLPLIGLPILLLAAILMIFKQTTGQRNIGGFQ